MENFHTEEQQVEAIKNFWHKNGNSLIVGALVGLAGFVGYNFYQDNKFAEQIAASEAYIKLQEVSQKQPADFTTQAEQYIAEHSGTSFAALTALILAKDAATKADWESVEKHLTTAINQTDDDGIKAIATIRLARVQIQLEKIEQALATLAQPLSTAFDTSIEETKGDAYLLQGKKELAREAYQAAIAKSPEGVNPSLQMKIDDLAQVITLNTTK